MSNSSPDDRIALVVNPDQRRIDVSVDGAPFTSYLYPDMIKKPILYPLRTATGTAVTRGYPLDPRPGERVDHPHQVGLWFNYGNVNGLDFWNNSDAIPPERRDRFGTIRHAEILAVEGGPEQGRLVVRSDWLAPAGHCLLEEETTFLVRGEGRTRTLDRIARLTAREDISFPDDKEGVLGIRVARELEAPDANPARRVAQEGPPAEDTYVDNEGVNGCYRSSAGLEGDAVWGTRGDWVKLTGLLAGETVSLVIFDHPGNPGYPTYWHARGYGLFAANPLGRAAFSNGADTLNFKLPAGETATFKYRVLIDLRVPLPDDVLNEEFRDFAAT